MFGLNLCILIATNKQHTPHHAHTYMYETNCIFFLLYFFLYTLFRYPKSSVRYSQVYRTLQRIKKGVLPKNPVSIQEINEAFRDPEILKSFGNAYGIEEKFFDAAVETDNFSYCIFSSKKMINLINTRIAPNKRHILLDATFRTVPFGPFTQLLIFYVRVDHQVSSSFFFLFVFLLLFFPSDIFFLFSLFLLFFSFPFFSSLFIFFHSSGFSFCFLSNEQKKSSSLRTFI